MAFEDSGAEAAGGGVDETWPALSDERLKAFAFAPEIQDGRAAPSGNWRDVAGKIWNAPNTALGLAYGGPDMAAGEVGPDSNPPAAWPPKGS